MSNKGDKEAPYLITFSDLIYGVLLGYGFSPLSEALRKGALGAVILLAFVFILLCDNWYGSHYVSIRYHPPHAAFTIHIMDMFSFFLMMYFASTQSVFLVLLIVVHALLGVVWNQAYLKVIPSKGFEMLSLRLWTKTALVLGAVFLSLFIVFYVFLNAKTLNLWMISACVSSWAVWRVYLFLKEP